MAFPNTQVNTNDNQEEEFKVSEYNKPSTLQNGALMEALAEAKTAFEANAIGYKIYAAGELSSCGLFPSEKEGGHLMFGEIIPLADKILRADIVCRMPDDSAILVRFLAKNEKFAPTEMSSWLHIAQNPMVARIVFVHESDLFPNDQDFIDKFMAVCPRISKLMIPLRNT